MMPGIEAAPANQIGHLFIWSPWVGLQFGVQKYDSQAAGNTEF